MKKNMKTAKQKLYSRDTDHPSIRGARGSRTTDHGSLSRRNFIKACAAGSVVLPFISFACTKTHKRPNIVFIFPDQMRSMVLSCYGNNQVKTPNIDRLAKEGVKFTHACSTYPVCSPFRAMLMTGNQPCNNGMMTNDHYLDPGQKHFAEICKQNGYDTGYVGKWHLDGQGRKSYIPPERRLGFDWWKTLECTHKYFKSDYYNQNEKKLSQWQNFDSIDQTDAACEYIKDHSKNINPFCLFVSWGPPHDPYISPKKYMDRFPPEKIKLRENVNDFKTAEKMWNECNTKLPENLKPLRKLFYKQLKEKNNNSVRKWYQGYYASTELLDDCLGKIYETLKKTGELDNTIIVFSSDHGDNLASHRQYGKQSPYEEAISIPFIIRYPEKIKSGTVTDALLAPVDIMPTLFSLADIKCPKVDGKDISGAAVGQDENIQDALLLMKMTWLSNNWIFNGAEPFRGVRTKRYTYVRKSATKEPWLLFDNEKDPYQVKNLIDSLKHKSMIGKLDKKTDLLLKEANDPETPSLIAEKKARQPKNALIADNVMNPKNVKPGSGFKNL